MTHPLATSTLALTLAATGLAMVGAARAGDLYVLSPTGLGSAAASSGIESDIDLVRQARIGLHTPSSGNTEFKGKLGYQLSPNFAVEGGYVDPSTTGHYARLQGGLMAADTKFSGMNVSALGIMPVSYQLSVFGKVGYTAGSLRGTDHLSGSPVHQDKNSLGMGLGGIYQLTPTIGVRAEWERPYTDVNLLTLGLRASF